MKFTYDFCCHREHFAGFVEPQNIMLRNHQKKLSKRPWLTTLVIVNDGTCPTPTKYVLDIIADDLAEAGAEFIRSKTENHGHGRG